MGGELELELELLQPIIQRIQSFLTGKEAARTTILSKSWYSAWLTRPNIDLDESDFEERNYEFYNPATNEFSNYAKKTIKSWYEQSNLKIDSFNLCISTLDSYAAADLANELIGKALGELGATRLNFQLNCGRIVLPLELLFGADNLVSLSVTGTNIKLDGMEKKCCRLESLYLEEVGTTSDGLSNLISCCPLIENLTLSQIIYDNDYTDTVRPRPVCLMNTKLDRLRCLVLCYKSIKTLFPGDLLSKFPFLTDLTIHVCMELESCRIAQEEDVHISNHSLERVKLEWSYDDDGCSGRGADDGILRGPGVKLDVPSLRKFTFEGRDVIPKLSFVSSSTRKWESHVSITRFGGLTNFWFDVLNEFLEELRQSKIHLSLQGECQMGFDYRMGDASENRKHELENLTIDTTGLPSNNCYALLDGLFRLCRPKLVTYQTQKKEHNFFYGRQNPNQRKIIFDILCQFLEQGIQIKVSDPRIFLFDSLIDLEEANAQIFEDDVMGWRHPISLKSLLEDQEQHQQVRLLLKWKP